MVSELLAKPGFTGIMTVVGIGVLAGLVGTWFCVHKARSPDEKKTILAFASFLVVFSAVVLGVLFFLSEPFRTGLCVVYLVILCLALQWFNRRMEEIRKP